MKTAFVINPQSADGTTGRDWDELRQPLLEVFPDADEVFTQGPGDATRACREALDGGARVVVAVGGDGTNNEVVNGFFDEDGTPRHPEAVFSFVPRGTGCDFARQLGLPRKDVAEVARKLADAPTWPIDLGWLECARPGGGVNRKIYLNISDFGLGGLVSARVNQSSKRSGGFVSFLWHTLVGLWIYEDTEMVLEMTRGEEALETIRGTFRNVVLANGQFFGGGMNINAASQLDDGLLDLITLPDEGFLHYLRWLPALYSQGGVLHHPLIHHVPVTGVRARAADPADEVWVEMDGENPGMLPLTLRVLPGALRIRAPYPGDRFGSRVPAT